MRYFFISHGLRGCYMPDGSESDYREATGQERCHGCGEWEANEACAVCGGEEV